MARPTGYPFHFARTASAFPHVKDAKLICQHLRRGFLKCGFKSRTIKRYGLDNPFMSDDARTMLLMDALQHDKIEIEVVIA